MLIAQLAMRNAPPHLKFQEQDGVPHFLLLLDITVDDLLNDALILDPRDALPCHDISEAKYGFVL